MFHRTNSRGCHAAASERSSSEPLAEVQRALLVVLVLHAPHPEAGGLLGLRKLREHCESARNVRCAQTATRCAQGELNLQKAHDNADRSGSYQGFSPFEHAVAVAAALIFCGRKRSHEGRCAAAEAAAAAAAAAGHAQSMDGRHVCEWPSRLFRGRLGGGVSGDGGGPFHIVLLIFGLNRVKKNSGLWLVLQLFYLFLNRS